VIFQHGTATTAPGKEEVAARVKLATSHKGSDASRLISPLRAHPSIVVAMPRFE
jgi:hypothetical protein